MDNVCFIGGSPCSGKSMVAEALAKKHGLRYFKIDDNLEKYIRLGLEAQIPLVERMMAMDTDATWLRDPKVQCEEELMYYRATFPFLLNDLEALSREHEAVIAEGAALLPDIMREKGISRYFCMTPTREFQIRHYRERPWISQILQDSSDKETAFDNWMERDALFGEAVQADALRLGYPSIIVDGSKSVEETVGLAEKLLQL